MVTERLIESEQSRRDHFLFSLVCVCVYIYIYNISLWAGQGALDAKTRSSPPGWSQQTTDCVIVRRGGRGGWGGRGGRWWFVGVSQAGAGIQRATLEHTGKETSLSPCLITRERVRSSTGALWGITHARTRAHTHTRVHTHTCTHTLVHHALWGPGHTRTLRTQAHTHTHTHTCIHTHSRSSCIVRTRPHKDFTHASTHSRTHVTCQHTHTHVHAYAHTYPPSRALPLATLHFLMKENK